MTFIEYIEFLRSKKFGASFRIERDSNSDSDNYNVQSSFSTPYAALIEENLKSILNGDVECLIYEVELNTKGQIIERRKNWILRQIENAEISWPNLSDVMGSLPQETLKTYFNLDEQFDSLTGIDPQLLSETYVVFTIEDGQASGELHVGDTEVNCENLLGELITDYIESDMEDVSLTLNYFGSDEPNELYGEYSYIVGDITEEIIDVKDCVMKGFGLKFELNNQAENHFNDMYGR